MIALLTAAQGEAPVAVDARKQLFLDDYVIAGTENVTRRIHPAEKYAGNPVIRPTEAWEQPRICIYGSVLRDGDKYRAWYYCGGDVAYAQSVDGLKWNIFETGKGPVVMAADAADPPGTEIYSMMVFPYESVFIGLVQRFNNQPETCTLDVQLAVSHDTVHFTRVGDRTQFIPVGAVGSWDRFNLSLANNPPIVEGDRLRFYYGGRMRRHSPYAGEDRGEKRGGVGLATVKLDRFVSLGASFDGGRIVTKPLKLTGSQLHLNAKSDFGQIVVEALGPDGRRLARSKPICQDSLDVPVQWEQGNLEGVKTPVVLHITLRNALLFALWTSA